MNKKIAASIIALIVVCAVVAVAAYAILGTNQISQTPTGVLYFTVSGSSSCLRFLNDSVPMVYIPFTVAANQQMQLTINATKMPGGANGWTDVYIYKGYWNKGTNNTCVSGDVYPIISDIKSADSAVMLNSPYTATYGDTTKQSYTVFFVFPPGGQAQFHIALKPTYTTSHSSSTF